MNYYEKFKKYHEVKKGLFERGVRGKKLDGEVETVLNFIKDCNETNVKEQWPVSGDWGYHSWFTEYDDYGTKEEPTVEDDIIYIPLSEKEYYEIKIQDIYYNLVYSMKGFEGLKEFCEKNIDDFGFDKDRDTVFACLEKDAEKNYQFKVFNSGNSLEVKTYLDEKINEAILKFKKENIYKDNSFPLRDKIGRMERAVEDVVLQQNTGYCAECDFRHDGSVLVYTEGLDESLEKIYSTTIEELAELYKEEELDRKKTIEDFFEKTKGVINPKCYAGFDMNDENTRKILDGIENCWYSCGEENEIDYLCLTSERVPDNAIRKRDNYFIEDSLDWHDKLFEIEDKDIDKDVEKDIEKDIDDNFLDR